MLHLTWSGHSVLCATRCGVAGVLPMIIVCGLACFIEMFSAVQTPRHHCGHHAFSCIANIFRHLALTSIDPRSSEPRVGGSKC